ncbi:MAG: amidohydrolase family protein [Candidatus Latescibacteria bacterium]|nr:amidohydrolase family protein [Candidatus Latescibacterota bacterium]
MSDKALFHRLKTEIDTLPTVDIHEHLCYPEEDYLNMDVDFGRFLSGYTLDDLLSAGLEIPDILEYKNTQGAVLRINGKPLSHDEKWNYIKPYWKHIRFTGYSRAMLYSLNKLLGFDDLNDSNYREVTEKLKSLMKPGLYTSILKDTCGFTHILNDIDTMAEPGAYERMDRNLFKFVSRFRNFVYAYLPGGIRSLETTFNRPIRNIDHILDAMDEQFDRWKKDKRVALKIADAYLRDIHYEDSTRDEAEQVFNRLFTLRRLPHLEETLSFTEARPFENYITHRMLDRAEEHGFPVIVHTGIQTHMANELANSRAVHLTNLFMKYPGIHFHILHCGYPWVKEAICFAKQFSNVSLDLTWLHIIVPEGAREGLSHMLDLVPVNKIHCFGGDMLIPESVWGALEVARENIAHVLAEKVGIGHMTETQAVETAQKLLHKNAVEIFSLDD